MNIKFSALCAICCYVADGLSGRAAWQRLELVEVVGGIVEHDDSRLVIQNRINDVESLRGIYRGVNDSLHNDKIHSEWKRFAMKNPNPTRLEVLRMVQVLDKKYGRLFIPTEGI